MKEVKVNDRYQKNYKYTLTEKEGKNFDPEFKPDLTPKQMLKLGIFGGKYFDGEHDEFPKDWFKGASLSVSGKYEKDKNYFGIKASQSLEEWQKKGWIYNEDPRGWFQWYCRYYLGRRIPKEDARQIKRWKAISRHIAQIVKNCRKGDESCRARQRQAVLHWAYDSRGL
ncbi:MAG: hypothetical protein WC087_01095 [Candidatus Paceibacterota bacterium]